MAQNIKPAAQKPEDPTVPKKSSKKLVIGAAAALVVVISAGASWYFSKGNHAAVAEVKIAPPKTPIFVALEPFTVNLQREYTDQYLQLGITMKVFDAENEVKIKASLPEIRSNILQLLTTKTATELLTAEGKTRLVKEIMTMSNTVIGIAPARPVAPVTPVVPAAAHAADSEAHAAPVAEAASAPVALPVPAVVIPAEITGIVDVLFTSFIIQ